MPSPKGRSSGGAGLLTTVTLKQLAAELADSHDLLKTGAEALLADLITLSIRHLRNGHGVRLTGLGLPRVQRQSPRRGVNLRTGEVIEIRGKGEITFRPAKELKDTV